MATSAWLEAYAEDHPKIGRIGKDLLSLAWIQVPQTLSVFHPHAQQNAFRRRDARQQRRLFARKNPRLTHSPNSNRLS
jgi:hypothetical protein